MLAKAEKKSLIHSLYRFSAKSRQNALESRIKLYQRCYVLTQLADCRGCWVVYRDVCRSCSCFCMRYLKFSFKVLYSSPIDGRQSWAMSSVFFWELREILEILMVRLGGRDPSLKIGLRVGWSNLAVLCLKCDYDIIENIYYPQCRSRWVLPIFSSQCSVIRHEMPSSRDATRGCAYAFISARLNMF